MITNETFWDDLFHDLYHYHAPGSLDNESLHVRLVGQLVGTRVYLEECAS